MRLPDVTIKKENGLTYLNRWFVIPRNRFLNIYLHQFLASDDDRALHDHPWFSVSFMLKGEIVEHSFKGLRIIPRFIPVFRSAKFAHRLEVVKGPVWTLFITGPRIRSWGFYCHKGWRHWEHFTTKKENGETVGCD